ncbi:beta-ketoacyl-ACP synthase II [Candidatus Fermentibacteria bacterium]|nr:beta-ketoacyl-ACP synthase II [Candidatus Fermentibacteria bacterium]
MPHRVVVTGMGALTPLGLSVQELWDGIRLGNNGITRLSRFDPSAFDSQIAGELKGFDPEPILTKKEARRMDLFLQYAVVAAEEAVRGARIAETGFVSPRAGVIFGSGIGGIQTLTSQHDVLLKDGPGRVSPFFVPMMIADMAPGLISMRHGLRGVNFATVSACASAAHAVGEAFRAVQHGHADLMIAGGSEASICPLSYAGFCSMKALARRNHDPQGASRPFDRDRDGFVMAEGAGALVLERLEHALARGVEPLAEIAGYGASADAYHMTAPDPEGVGATQAMAEALHDAGISPDAVDYINAHGTSTKLNDVTETLAIHRVFGPHATSLMVSSTKSMLGHTLGASGAIELIATILQIRHGWVHPTANLENPDPQCDLDYVPLVGRTADISVALSNSFGFGGHNASIVVRRAP